jgi:hypothetical protein
MVAFTILLILMFAVAFAFEGKFQQGQAHSEAQKSADGLESIHFWGGVNEGLDSQKGENRYRLNDVEH